MSRLQELNNALILIILRYHESQRASIKLTGNGKTESDILSELNNQPIPEMLDALQKLIDGSTGVYQTRRPLLNYFQKAVGYTSHLLKSDAALSNEAFSKTKSFLLELVINTQQILAKSKGTKTSVTCDDVNYDLDGLTQGVWAGYGYCTSGTIINKTLFPALYPVTSNTNQQDIESCIDNICQEQQTALTLKQTQTQLTQAQQKIDALEQTNTKLAEENKALKDLHDAQSRLNSPATQACKEIHARYIPPNSGVSSSSMRTAAQYTPSAGSSLFAIANLARQLTTTPPITRHATAAPPKAAMEDNPLESTARLTYFPY